MTHIMTHSTETTCRVITHTVTAYLSTQGSPGEHMDSMQPVDMHVMHMHAQGQGPYFEEDAVKTDKGHLFTQRAYRQHAASRHARHDTCIHAWHMHAQ